MIVAAVIILVALGSVIFHFFSPWFFTPIASNWGNIDTTITITFLITGIVFVVVLFFTGYCVVKYRKRDGHTAEYEPENKKLESWLIGLTTIGVVGLLAPGLFVWSQYVSVPDDAAEIEVVGRQWEWSYRFPGNDGQLGITDVRYINDVNPFGVNPDDPNGQDDVLVEFEDLHLPIGQPVKVLLRSIDVLHDFWVPEFRAKMDLVPGLVSFFWFTPTRDGTYDILCAELCGSGHFAMRSTVVIEDEADYQAWLAEMPTFAQSQEEAGIGEREVRRLAARAQSGGEEGSNLVTGHADAANMQAADRRIAR